MELRINLYSNNLSLDKFKELIEKQVNLNESDIHLEIKRPNFIPRGLDPTILVAIVGAAGTCLGAFLSGILQILKQTKSEKIVIQTKNGSRIEIPANTSADKLDQYIEKIKELELGL